MEISAGKVFYNRLLGDRFADGIRPVKGSLANGWREEIQHRVLGNWARYGFSTPAAATPGHPPLPSVK